MASGPAINSLKLSLGVTFPLVIDFAYHEGYLVGVYPGYWTRSRFDRLFQFEALRNVRRTVYDEKNSALHFTRYRTENPLHASYIHTKKSVWKVNTLWPLLAGVASALQIHSLFVSFRRRALGRALFAVGAMGLTWAGVVLENESRYWFLQDMKERVVQVDKTLPEPTT